MMEDVKNALAKLEVTLDQYMVKKAPALPIGFKQFLVKFVPYVVVVSAVFAIPSILAMLGLSAILTPFAMLGGSTYGVGARIFSVGLTLLVSTAIQLYALPGLFKLTKASWKLGFYATLVSVLGDIVSLNIVYGVFAVLISWYFLFQVKELYKN